MLKNLELTTKKAKQDIELCLETASTPVSFDKENPEKLFIDSPHIYLNSNDRLRNLTSIVGENTSVLTVASSGDYMLDSISRGAKEIVNFDINYLQYYVLKLKLWAIETLSYTEYLNFFTKITSTDYLSPTLFDKILYNHKAEPEYTFWEIFKKQREKENEEYIKLLHDPTTIAILTSQGQENSVYKKYIVSTEIGPDLKPDIFKTSSIIQSPFSERKNTEYLSSRRKYKKVKSLLDKVDITFINSDLKLLHTKLQGKNFDAIFLSNISSYLKPNDFATSIENIYPLLNQKGQISYYNPGMKLDWFRGILIDENYQISDSEFLNNHYAEIEKQLFASILKSYRRLISEGYKVYLEEVDSAYSSVSSKAKTDVKALIK